MKDLISSSRLAKPDSKLVAQLKLKKPETDDKMNLVTRPTLVDPKVGNYMRGSIIDVPIRGERVNEFYFLKRTISRDQINLLNFTTTERYGTGALVYECRPYALQIGDLKIFYSDFRKQINRCKILNMYNKVNNGCLIMKVDILLIDEGAKRRNVPVHCIYEIPTQVKNIMDIAPCANYARLKLEPALPKEFQDQEVDRYFSQLIRKTKHVKMKLLDYVGGCYVVDLMDERGNSLADHINRKFRSKFEDFNCDYMQEQMNLACSYETAFPSDPFVLASHHTRKPKSGASSLSSQQHYETNTTRYYPGALRYFQQREKEISKNQSVTTTYSMLEQLHRVRVIFWRTSDHFYVIPNDPQYMENFGWLKKQIAKFQEFLAERHKEEESHEYRVGDWCLFKNDKDPNLGKWCRGVVVKVPSARCGILLAEDLAKRCRIKCKNDEKPSPTTTLASDRASFVYHIRSLDFGFQCVRGADSLMPIPSNHQLLKIPAWSMRCKLFGIFPFNLENAPRGTLEFADHCNLRIASWMYERISNDERYSNFHVLFRSPILELSTHHLDAEARVEITLFHKQVFRPRVDDCFKLKKRIPEMDCLNCDLIQEGRADSRPDSKHPSSCVDLDHHLVNTLIIHKFSQ